LRLLQGDALRLWSDADERRRAIQDLVDLLGSDDVRARSAVDRIDRAVAEALHLLALPRAPIRQVEIVAGPGPLGQKWPDCTLQLNGDRMRALLTVPRGPDTTFRTWVHESIHGRQPFTAPYRTEYAQTPGYEEGLAEGLARFVVREQGGLDPIQPSYNYYVAAYRTAAQAVGIDAEQLWRLLFRAAPGTVRGDFTGAADALRQARSLAAFTAGQRRNLLVAADRMFGLDRLNAVPNEDAMIQMWRVALR
jgi:hypothetical protein